MGGGGSSGGFRPSGGSGARPTGTGASKAPVPSSGSGNRRPTGSSGGNSGVGGDFIGSDQFIGSDSTDGECDYNCNPGSRITKCRVKFIPNGSYSGNTEGLCFNS